MPYTYPPAAPTISGDVETINRFLQSPTLVSRALRTIAQQRYISDRLLQQRFQVSGGSVLYETGESIFTNDNPQSVAPGSEYPLTSATTGAAQVATVQKWGQDFPVTDEAIKRQLMNPVNRALLKLVNRNVQFIDSQVLSGVATAVGAANMGGSHTKTVTTSWKSANGQQILGDVAQAKAFLLSLNQGYDPDIIVVDDFTWASAYVAFVNGGFLPREQGAQNPVATGQFPVIDGLLWLPTPNGVAGTALIADSKTLGGMADEDLGGPGYANAGAPGVEGKSIRDDERDAYRLRMRRVTVPIVQEPNAGYLLNGVAA